MPVTLVAISDTHGLHRSARIPDGDILIHAGDLTRHGDRGELAEFNEFLGALPHREKIVVAGNHDFCFERHRAACEAMLTHATYLQDQAVTVQGLRLYGSPWQPWFLDWAFNLQRGPEIRAKWDLIPPDTDVLITHGPVAGRHDTLSSGKRVGCGDLLAAVERVRPRAHVFGHIHEGYGTSSDGHTLFVNASICDAQYRPANAPIVFEL